MNGGSAEFTERAAALADVSEVTCEACDRVVPESHTVSERVPGYDGPITLYFCDGCSR